MIRRKVLLVEDEAHDAKQIGTLLEPHFELIWSSNRESARRQLRRTLLDAVLLDLYLPERDEGMKVLKMIKGEEPGLPVIVLTRSRETKDAVESMKAGAFHYLEKRCYPEELREVLVRAVEVGLMYRKAVALEVEVERLRGGFARFVGESKPMLKVFEQIRKVAPTDYSVLLLGESGTGKELAAREIHSLSTRSKGPFIAVNMAAVAPSLAENELFGHLPGSYTNAMGSMRGKFELAHRGTIFLDEIGKADKAIQAKLLRVIEERKVWRIGAEKPIDVDFRVICASSQNLENQSAKGEFLSELYYRVSDFPIMMPPLRERGDDVLRLAYHFAQREAKLLGKKMDRIAEGAMEFLMGQDWKGGNVRALHSLMKRAVVHMADPVMRLGDLVYSSGETGEVDSPARYKDAKQKAVRKFKQEYLARLLAACDGDVDCVSRSSGLPPQSIYRMFREMGWKFAELKKE